MLTGDSNFNKKKIEETNGTTNERDKNKRIKREDGT